MNIDRGFIVLPVALLALAGCTQDFAAGERPAAEFGEPNRQTMMAQVIDPEPEYATLVPETSAEHAADAVDRYNQDAVKQPERVRITSSTVTGN